MFLPRVALVDQKLNERPRGRRPAGDTGRFRAGQPVGTTVGSLSRPSPLRSPTRTTQPAPARSTVTVTVPPPRRGSIRCCTIARTASSTRRGAIGRACNPSSTTISTWSRGPNRACSSCRYARTA